MHGTPHGWPRISSSLFYREPARMIEWLCAAFDFEIRLKIEGDPGTIIHSELLYGDGVVMVSPERVGAHAPYGIERRSPLTAGGVTQSLFLYVDDVDAHCARARAAGARIVDEPTVHDYGEDHWADRTYAAVDPEGHLWWFAQRIRTAAA